MKFYLFLLILTTTASCGSVKRRELSIQEEVTEHEVKSLSEVKAHAQNLLNKHPELSNDTKTKLSLLISKTMNRLQLLKDQESKIVQFLLNKAIEKSEKDSDTKDFPEHLKTLLKNVYNSKYENILSLINQIDEMYKKNEIDQTFTRDAQIFMRDFR